MTLRPLLVFCATAAIACAQSPRTHTFKTVGDLAIQADVYAASGPGPNPVAVWIHGGALINGGRQSIPPRLRELLLEAGYAIVSIDYRLAPETKLPVLIEDLEDAFDWIRARGPALFGGDPDRIGVLGSSAGGYLTLTSGFRANPRPNVLVSFWGYGDLIGPWYSAPSGHERHNRIKMTREEALSQVSGPPIANSADRNGNGGAFYQHCRQLGSWPREVSGWDPKATPEKFYPYMPLQNFSSDYPPTLLIHGTADTDVPYEQSVLMDAELSKHGVEHELISAEGAEHGLAGADSSVVENAYRSAVAFLNKHIGP